MARPCRLQAENCFYHITSRGDGRKAIYKSERDCEKFLEYLAVAKDKFKFYVHAYCLMTNHYHLFIETTQANLSRIMQYLNTAYTVYYNVKRKKSGHLFQGRYKSIIVEVDAYYNELSRYIHLNPVRAKMVRKPSDYRWSSYNAYLSGRSIHCLDIEQVKQRLTMPLAKYRSFVESVQDYPDPLKGVYAGCILGGVKFIKDKLDQLKSEVEIKDFAHKWELKSNIKPETIINVVAQYYREDQSALLSAKKKSLLARKVAIYVLKKFTPLTNNDIGGKFGISHAGVSWIAADIDRQIMVKNKLRHDLDRITLQLEV